MHPTSCFHYYYLTEGRQGGQREENKRGGGGGEQKEKGGGGVKRKMLHPGRNFSHFYSQPGRRAQLIPTFNQVLNSQPKNKHIFPDPEDPGSTDGVFFLIILLNL